MAERQHPPDSTVVAADIGVIGYYSERNIIDLAEQERLLVESFRIRVDGFRLGDNTEDDYVVYRISWRGAPAHLSEASGDDC